MKFPILLPNIFNHPFTYESDLKLKIGDFVEVSFGKSKIIGVVWDELEKENQKKFQIKKIIKKVDVPSLKKDMILFLNWFSEYNIVPKGMSLNSIICFVSAINNLDKFGSVYGVWFIDSLGRL